MSKKSYTVYINSNDKMPGNKNNNATYQINWNDFIDRKYNSYKIRWNFTSSASLYVDAGIVYTSAVVYVDFFGKTYSFDTTTKSASSCLGYIHRDSTKTVFNYFTCSHTENCPKTIDRPTQNFITIRVINTDDGITPLTETDTNGVPQSDMSSYFMCIEFEPVEGSEI